MLHTQPPPSFWLKLIQSPSCRARSSAIRNLAQIWPGSGEVWGEVIPALVQVLRFDPTLAVRQNAAWGLMEIGSLAAKAVPALIEAVRERDDVIRWYAVVALHHIGPPAAPALPVLIEALSDPNPALRGWAAMAIAALGPEAILDPLEAAGWPPERWPEGLTSAGPYTRVLISLALGTRGREGATALTEVFTDPSPEVRRTAAAALVLLKGEGGNALEHATGHPDAAVRLFAAVALMYHGPEAARKLRSLLADDDGDVRYMAARSLSQCWGYESGHQKQCDE